MKPFTRTSLSIGISLSTLFLQATAFGQSEIEEIVVTSSPIRDSLASALTTKREARNVLDVISADTIGRFPDQNLADSLGRLPGLAIERDQGQARFVNMRGAPFRYSSIAFDGISVLGAENGRTPRFDAFPSVITRSVEANKAITPDLPGESIAGYININTFDPMALDGFHFSGEAGYGEQALGNVDIDKYNGRLSYSDDAFGVLLFGSHDLRGRITDNREYEVALDANNNLVVSNLDFRSYRGERENNSWGGRLEFAPNDTVSRVYFSTVYSEFIDSEERNQFDFDFMEPVTGTQASNEPLLITRLLEDGLYENSTWTNTFGLEYSQGAWESEFRINYTETANDTFLPIPRSLGAFALGSYDLSDIENPSLTLTDPAGAAVDPNTIAYPVTIAILFGGAMDTEATQFKYDTGSRTTLFGTDTEIKFGGRIDYRSAVGGSALSVGGFPNTVDIATFASQQPWDTDMSNTIGGRNFDNAGVRAAWEQAAGGITAPFGDDSIVNIDEDIYAVYAMGTALMGWGEVVYGVRVEHTSYDTSGLLNGSPVDVSDSYTNVLPSINASINLQDELKLRLAATTGISRPTYNEMRASATVDATENPPFISGGNPYVEAEESIGFDASLEWYYSPTGLLSASAFYRSIDNVIYADTSVIPDGSVYAPGLIAAGTPTSYNAFYNGDDGKLQGLELNLIAQADFLPGALQGFGFQGNVTFLDSEFSAPTQAGRKYSLPGTSDLIYNASIYYENYGLSARLNYMYRDDWLSTTENDSLTEYWAEEERMDLSVRYSFPQSFNGLNVTLFANANNLTDAVDVRYANSAATPNQVERFGRRYLLGIRVDY
jgi:TonB-dependent receptor